MHINILKIIYRSKAFNYFIWLIISVFYAFQMMLRVLPAIMMDFITQKYGMDAGQFGLLTGFYYLGYAGMQIPIGALLDRFHPRFVISGCILLCVSGILATIYSIDRTNLYVARLIIGAGSVAGILGSVKAIDDFFPKKYSLMLGCTIFIGVCGAYYGGTPIRKSLEIYSPEETLLFLVYIGLAIATCIMIFYRKSHNEDKAIARRPVMESLKTCLCNKKLWWVGLLGGCMVGPIGGFADMWGGKYLIQAKNLSCDQASMAMTLVFLGFGIGCPITGYIAQYFKSLPKLICVFGLMQLIVLAGLFLTDGSKEYIIFLLCCWIGVFCSYQVAVFAIANRFAAGHVVSIVTSVIDMMIMFFGFIFNYGIGFILRSFFTSTKNDIIFYDSTAYHTAFSLIIVGIVISLIGFSKTKFTSVKTH